MQGRGSRTMSAPCRRYERHSLSTNDGTALNVDLQRRREIGDCWLTALAVVKAFVAERYELPSFPWLPYAIPLAFCAWC